jgi:hypothetical protein
VILGLFYSEDFLLEFHLILSAFLFCLSLRYNRASSTHIVVLVVTTSTIFGANIEEQVANFGESWSIVEEPMSLV